MAVVTGAVSFFLLVGAGPLDGSHAVWSNPPNDLPQMMAGFEALFREPWGFPPTVSSLLVQPIPVSIVFTDSIPWLALAMKAAGIGPGAVNPLALFLLLSQVLQAAAMVALLHAAGVRRAAVLLCGAALALLLPAWIYRQIGHIALSGHWLILFALALAVAAARTGLTRGVAAGFAALGALSAGVHAYHVVPVSACCAAALASELLQRRPGALRRAATAGLAFAAALGGAAALLGYGVGRGPTHGGSILGFLSMNLAAPLMPQGSTLFGHEWTAAGGYTGTVDPTGGQWFEGYNYLGAGIVLLVAVAAAVAVARAASRPWGPGAAAALLRRYGPLGGALLALALMAIGPNVYAGERLLLDLPRPEGALGDALGYLRAHGRLFWAVAYALLAASLAALDRRLPLRAVLALCAAAFLLQAYDTSGMRRTVGGAFAGPAPLLFPAALQDSPAAAGRHWRFVPTLHCLLDESDKDVIRQMALVAVRRGGSSNSAPTARNPLGGCAEPVGEAFRDAAAPMEALVVLRRSLAADGALAAIAARKGPCHAFEHVLVCGDGFEGVPGLPRVEPADLLPRLADLLETVPLAGPLARADLFAQGWSVPEPTHRWTDGGEAALVFLPPAEAEGSGVVLQLEAVAYAGRLPGGQRVAASVNGGPATDWLVGSGAWETYELPLPPLAEGRPMVVRFDLPDAVSPAEMSREPGSRRLGIAVRRLSFRSLDGP